MIIISFFVLLSTFYLTLKLSKYFKVSQITISIIFLLRTLISLVYLPIAKSGDLDSYGYYNYAFSADLNFYGQGLIFSINNFLRSFFNLDIYSVTFIFSFIGIIGTLALISNIQNLSKHVDKKLKLLSILIIYFPTLNLWTSTIGKDAITFACINLIIFAFFNIRTRLLILIISTILFSLVRPFIGIILILALSISLTYKLNLPFLYKFILRIFLFSGIFFINSINKEWMQFENLRFSQIFAVINYYQEATQLGENSIDLSSLNFPMKIFTFMFRPLFLDAKGIYPLLMSFENIILFLISLYPFTNILILLKIKKLKLNSMLIFSSIYLSSTWIFYSLTMANLGTANRYKIMFIPVLIYLSLILSEKSRYRFSKKQNYIIHSSINNI